MKIIKDALLNEPTTRLSYRYIIIYQVCVARLTFDSDHKVTDTSIKQTCQVSYDLQQCLVLMTYTWKCTKLSFAENIALIVRVYVCFCF